jgi:hypothetical protein
VVVRLTPGKPVTSFAIVTMESVDGAALDQPPKLAVDGGDPHPQTLRSQVSAETTMKLGGAQKPVGTLENL